MFNCIFILFFAGFKLSLIIERWTDYYLRWIWGEFPVTKLAHVIKCASPDHNFGQYSLQTMAYTTVIASRVSGAGD